MSGSAEGGEPFAGEYEGCPLTDILPLFLAKQTERDA